MQNSASKFKTHPKSAEIVKNKALLKNVNCDSLKNPLNCVSHYGSTPAGVSILRFCESTQCTSLPAAGRPAGLSVYFGSRLDFSIISLEEKKLDKMAGKNSDQNIQIPPALLVRFALNSAYIHYITRLIIAQKFKIWLALS